ncbi:MAG: molybdopterin dinucleotide binding domain-containing protein [Eubacteriales bacterium]
MADLFLPSTTFLEEDDIIISSWSNYLIFAPKVVEPAGESKSDPVIFTELARLMGLDGFPDLTPLKWLEKALAPVAGLGVTLEKLQEGPLRNPLAPTVAWADKKFNTPTGKYELYSERALAEGIEPLPVYREPEESPVKRPDLAKEYPFHLLTCHHRDFLHSQFHNLRQKEHPTAAKVEIHPVPAANRGIEDGVKVIVKSPRGQIEAVARLTDRVPTDVVQIYQGNWIKYGGGVNFLTPDHLPDMGLGTSYYDCLCEVRRK